MNEEVARTKFCPLDTTEGDMRCIADRCMWWDIDPAIEGGGDCIVHRIYGALDAQRYHIKEIRKDLLND